MSASRISRREFGVGALASLVMSACSRDQSSGGNGQPANTSPERAVAGGGQSGPILRLIGAFTFHEANTTTAYAFDSRVHPHDPVLIVETELITQGAERFAPLDQQSLARLRKVHKSFDPSRSYSALCSTGQRLRINAGEGRPGTSHLPTISGIASRANDGTSFEADLDKLSSSKLIVDFGSGELRSGVESEAPGGEKTWQFRFAGMGVSDQATLTDVTDYISELDQLSVGSTGTEPIAIRSKRPSDVVYIINLAQMMDIKDKTPNLLEHTAHYFTYVKSREGNEPAKKPMAHCVENDLTVFEAEPLRVSCGARLMQLNPPDTEFCIQMTI